MPFVGLCRQHIGENIIEAGWDHLDRERNKGQPESKELWEVLKEVWYNIPEITKENVFTLPKEFKMRKGRSH